MKFRDENILNAFAIRVKEIRSQKNISQEELAYSSGLSLSQIARIETGKINPTLCTVVIIAKHLDIHPKDLLDFELPGA